MGILGVKIQGQNFGPENVAEIFDPQNHGLAGPPRASPRGGRNNSGHPGQKLDFAKNPEIDTTGSHTSF